MSKSTRDSQSDKTEGNGYMEQKTKSKKPIQIIDGVIVDPNIPPRMEPVPEPPKPMPKFREYAKLKTREELMKLANERW